MRETPVQRYGSKCLSLSKSIEGNRPHLEKKLDELLKSDFIDFEKEDDNYYLPKNIMQALAREMEFQYANVRATRSDNRKINKLYRAIRYGAF